MKKRKMKMMRNDFSQVMAQLRQADSIIITSHRAPDGDAVGTMLAMYHLLKALGKERVACINHDPVPKKYLSLPGVEVIAKTPDFEAPFDLAIIVDVAQMDRLGDAAQFVSQAKTTIVLDHHCENSPCGDINIVDTNYSAAAEIPIELFEAFDIPISHEAAECAYVALITDTGGFRFSNTNPQSHEIAAKLLQKEIDVAGISQQMFDAMPPQKLNLLKTVLARATFSDDGRIAWACLTLKDINNAKANSEDTDGLINFLRNVEGVDVAILIKEIDKETTKISFRSSEAFSALEASALFGGGGHKSAAGATVKMPMEQVQQEVLERVQEMLAESA